LPRSSSIAPRCCRGCTDSRRRQDGGHRPSLGRRVDAHAGRTKPHHEYRVECYGPSRESFVDGDWHPPCDCAGQRSTGQQQWQRRGEIRDDAEMCWESRARTLALSRFWTNETDHFLSRNRQRGFAPRLIPFYRTGPPETLRHNRFGGLPTGGGSRGPAVDLGEGAERAAPVLHRSQIALVMASLRVRAFVMPVSMKGWRPSAIVLIGA
jgi:hypothetical protein